jgi:predicted RNA-binding protein with PUA-like domain
MNYWLVKSEPSAWSWDQMVKAKITHWDGVRNAQAASYLKQMAKGDRAFFYHSNEGKEIVGIVEIVKQAHPDPGDEKGRAVMVDVKAVAPLKHPVTLAQIKADAKLKNLALVRQSRLSVMPIDEASWKAILKLSETA